MRNLDFNEYKLCQILGRIFEKSVSLSILSSLTFIRRFMTLEESESFFDKTYLASSSNEEEIIYLMNERYAAPMKRATLNRDTMYWVGYIYGALGFLYGLSGKSVYRLFPAKEIVKYYNIYHTFGIEEAAERMMENIGYQKIDPTKKGVEIMKRLYGFSSSPSQTTALKRG